MTTAAQRRAVALAGASGYSGQEFLKILKNHPSLAVTELIGRDANLSSLKNKVEAAVLATPAEVSLEMAPKLLDLGIKVIDVSGAFRLKHHAYPEWYGFEHTEPQRLEQSVYGLYPWIKPSQKTTLVANPGCYTTASLMALLPLLKENVIHPDSIFVDASSGSSGAGKKLSQNLMFSELYSNHYAYKTGSHQHWPELVECLNALTLSSNTKQIQPNFVTKLLPIHRGILATIFSQWHPNLSDHQKNITTLKNAFIKHYGDQKDILILDREASIADVRDSNKIAISVHTAYNKPVVFCSIDNLVRGAAGQALMNLNQMLGLPAQEGLL